VTQPDQQQNGSEPCQPEQPSVFLSYRRLDDEIPPGEHKAAGFVRYLQDQLKYELTRELGLPEDVLWVDRNRIQTADDFTTVIADAIKKSDIFLAVVSWNYIRRDWCCAEVGAFSTHLGQMEKDAQARRIFRADKQAVDESLLPAPLRGLQAVRFYNKDAEKGVLEYYYRGKVAQKNAYRAAIRDLAHSIYARLQELGIYAARPAPRALLRKLVKNNRSVYVAAPSADTLDAYCVLVKELWTRGFTVIPASEPVDEAGNRVEDRPPTGHLPSEGAATIAQVRSALAASEVSIHLLGERRGFIPDGLQEGIVTLQLAEARAEAERRPSFRRLIWAPKTIPGLDPLPARDALHVLEQFDKFIDSDEIEGDTSARFNEFVLQRLLPSKPVNPVTAAPPIVKPVPSVFIAYLPIDQNVGLGAARRLKELGAPQIYFGAVGDGAASGGTERRQALMARADHVVFCWGAVDELQIVETLDLPVFQSWRAVKPKGHLCLLACDPDNDIKRSACQLGSLGQADLVIDGLGADLRKTMAPILGPAQ
jgi:hypothetical protein